MEQSKTIELPECPCCGSELRNMMTRVFRGVRWCHLCSFDVEEMPKAQQDELIEAARERAG